MKISVSDVRALREQTGAGIMEAKEALTEAGGDTTAAIEVLRKGGGAKAAKKAGRETREGRVTSYLHTTGKLGVLLKLYSETDFVARNEQFLQLAHDIALHIAGMAPENVEELLSQEFVKDSSKTIQDVLNESISRLGENIQIGDFIRYEL